MFLRQLLDVTPLNVRPLNVGPLPLADPRRRFPRTGTYMAGV